MLVRQMIMRKESIGGSHKVFEVQIAGRGSRIDKLWMESDVRDCRMHITPLELVMEGQLHGSFPNGGKL